MLVLSIQFILCTLFLQPLFVEFRFMLDAFQDKPIISLHLRWLPTSCYDRQILILVFVALELIKKKGHVVCRYMINSEVSPSFNQNNHLLRAIFIEYIPV